MFNWNPRRYLDIVYPYELPLHHFPGRPEMHPEPPHERYFRPLPPYVQPNAQSPPGENAGQSHVLSFMRRCYLLAVTYMLISVIQRLLFALIVKQRDIYMLPGFICLVLAFFLLLLLTFCPRLSSKRWIGIVFFTLFVETVTWGLVLLLPMRSPWNIMMAIVAAVIVLVLCYVAGAWLPMVVLPGELTLALILILFLAVGSIVLTLFIVTDEAKYHTIYFVLIGCVMVVLSIYHAQIVHGRRHWLPINEYLSCAVSIYIHFDLFFMVCYHIIWVYKWR
ncbi:uncharacterized protein LOC6567058 [Drosophila grimshawi]|uniref:GH13866 n=1 Tax=Drosophila grimshawi TaxID=7222 RepID=B4JP43_DROGR|nr:uncharacterized protein LOC6567058 [Drosophila grimshawi]EDV99468.1 GH13866 [Drosophila grimshawi]